MTITKKKERRTPPKMRIKLFMAFVIFVVLALVLMWSFQIFMLDTFYYQLTKSRMANAAEQIAAIYSSDFRNFKDHTTVIGLNNNFCIYAFNRYGNAIVKVDADTGCIIHAVSSGTLTNLYEKAKANGGEYFERGNLSGFDSSEKEAHKKYNVRGRILYSTIKSTNKGDLIIILDAAITPANVLKGALTMQLVSITVIMILFALLVSNVLAKKLSRPIADVNRAAKQLTVGEYDVEFTGEGYREIHELSETLNHTAQELKKTDVMQKELIANISHDLRTPLTLITGYCEMMRDIEGENTPENMQVVLDETARLSSLVNDLIDLSKYQNSGAKFEKENVNLDLLLVETVERYKKLMQGKDYTFVYESEGEIYAACDQKRILQVVYNLLSNAINYAGDDKTVIIRLAKAENGKARVEVEDHGAGIAKEDLPLVFDRYYKIDKVHKRAVTGTGLGLSIVKEILEKHGAVYGVQSEIGVGSIFFFEI